MKKKTELRDKTVRQLKVQALKLGIKRPSTPRKDDLVSEIMAAQKIKKSSIPSVAKTRKGGAAVRARTIAAKSTASRKTRETPLPRRVAAARRAAVPEPVQPAIVDHKFETPAHPAPRGGLSPYDNLGELPDAYGTGRLFFTARDPLCIYVAWDYTWQQMEEMRRKARHGELMLRVYGGATPSAPLLQEIGLNPAARNWFIQVNRANADFCAEFGYYDGGGRFIVTSRSNPTHTPPDGLSSQLVARFVTIPFHISFRELFELVKAHFRDAEELADVLHRLQADGFSFPFDYPRRGAELPAAMRGMVELFGRDLLRRIQMGSEVLTEWLQRRFLEETSSGLFAPSSPMGASLGGPPPTGFWLNVNAELIVYGATDAKAKVVFDGRTIALKPDGTFRFQFALPDGEYKLPVAATAPDGGESRAVQLRFVRQTSTRDDVGATPQSGELSPPTASAAATR